MKAVIAGIFLLALANATAAYAASDAINPNAEKCGKVYEQCYAQCRQENPAQTLKGDTGRATCGSVCVAKRTACMAGKGYDKAKPWVNDKIDKFNKFLDELFQEPPAAPAMPKNDGMKNI